MKKLLLLLMLLLPMIANAQDKVSVVTLKNGTQLNGVIKAIDPMDAMTIVIGGIETTIKMADVAKVEDANYAPQPAPAPVQQLSLNDKLVVTDMANYDEYIDLKLGDTNLRMILVRGGEMNMGFDGSGSMDMKSEPVHKVAVTSFYITETFVTGKLAQAFTDKKITSDYYMTGWKSAKAIVDSIADVTGLPFRLPTEAEWEYAACSKQQKQLFGKCNDEEYCSDYYGKFNGMDYEVDPTGPTSGRRHITRYFGENNEKFDRSQSTVSSYFRLVLKAKDAMQFMKSK